MNFIIKSLDWESGESVEIVADKDQIIEARGYHFIEMVPGDIFENVIDIVFAEIEISVWLEKKASKPSFLRK